MPSAPSAGHIKGSMKLVLFCKHLEPSKEEEKKIAQELYHPEHDGQYFVITKVCQECMTDILVKAARAQASGNDIQIFSKEQVQN